MPTGSGDATDYLTLVQEYHKRPSSCLNRSSLSVFSGGPERLTASWWRPQPSLLISRFRLRSRPFLLSSGLEPLPAAGLEERPLSLRRPASSGSGAGSLGGGKQEEAGPRHRLQNKGKKWQPAAGVRWPHPWKHPPDPHPNHTHKVRLSRRRHAHGSRLCGSAPASCLDSEVRRADVLQDAASAQTLLMKCSLGATFRHREQALKTLLQGRPRVTGGVHLHHRRRIMHAHARTHAQTHTHTHPTVVTTKTTGLALALA